MTQYRLEFKSNELRLAMVGYYETAAKHKIERRVVNAISDAQAFRIAQSIAKKNSWTVSGQPVKIN